MFVSRRRARKRIEKLVFLQKTFSIKLCRFRFLRLRKAIVRMQSGMRMRITRRKFTRTVNYIRYGLLVFVLPYDKCMYVCMLLYAYVYILYELYVCMLEGCCNLSLA